MDKKYINDIVKKIADGDDEAFEILYKTMCPILEAFLYNKLVSKYLIKDVINDTFLKVIEKSKTRMLFINCFSWIITIAKNTALNYNKKYSREYMTESNVDPTFDSESEEAELLDIETAISALTSNEREILLYKTDDLTFKEISSIMKISESSSKRLFEKSRRKFMQELYGKEDL